MKTPSNAELAAAFTCGVFALICLGSAIVGPMPYPSFATAAAISLCGAVLAIKG